MHFTVRAVRIPKGGSQPWEYEDDVRWNRGARGRRAARRYAVADGASESSFAAGWAALLTQAYIHGLLAADTLSDDLAPLQARWRADVAARPLPWYAAEKARAGAYAALVGLTLHSGGIWSALAAGDCCVFQIRGGLLIHAFPFTDAESFSRRPLLIGSNPLDVEHTSALVGTDCGTWAEGDIFMLMSDALAAHFLREVVTLGRRPLDVLPPSDHYSATFYRVARLRAEGSLRNDDVSLLSVQIHDPAPFARSTPSAQQSGLR